MNISKTLSDSCDPWRRWGFGWIPFWIYSTFVIKSALLRPEEIPEALARINDKVFHFTQYFFLFFFAVQAFRLAKTDWIRLRSKVQAFLYCLAMGILTEYLQFSVPGRSPAAGDWLADIGGAGLGLILYRLLTSLRAPQGRSNPIQ